MTRRFGKISTGLGALALVMALASPAQAQTTYSFTKVADSTADDFEPFSFGCATINARGDIAFKAGRLAADGFNTIPGIYRVNADGSLTAIAEDGKRFVTLGFNPSMNDLGEVAFKAELDEEFNFEEGLFSGSGRAITTHYLASTSDFGGNDSRPSINNLGRIGFDESINFDSGIFAGREGIFTTIAAPDPSVPRLSSPGRHFGAPLCLRHAPATGLAPLPHLSPVPGAWARVWNWIRESRVRDHNLLVAR